MSKWFEEIDSKNSNVIYSRVRLARNWDEYVFPSRMTAAHDLGRPQTVSEVRLAHAEAGGEGPDMNTRAYTVLVSEDGKDYEPVSRTLKNEAGTSTNTFAVKKVQYVKISIDKPTQGADSAARIYEVEVYGMDK